MCKFRNSEKNTNMLIKISSIGDESCREKYISYNSTHLRTESFRATFPSFPFNNK